MTDSDYGEYKYIEPSKNGARHYVFTLNNYTWQNFIDMWELLPKLRYIIFGAEICPTTGTPHLQGYLELSTPQRFSSFFKHTALGRARFAKRWGTRDQARNYCRKSDKDYFQWGNWEAGGQGARNDIHKMMQLIKEDKSELEIIEEEPIAVQKNHWLFDRYRSLMERELTRKFRHVEVIVHHGACGTGKTKTIFDEHPNAFIANCGESFPFNHYDGEKVLVLDDFYGHIKYHELLRILDGYQYRVNVKGSCRYARWEKVYITSNKRPDEWYKIGLTPALKRRITSIVEFRDEESIKEIERMEAIDSDDENCTFGDITLTWD